MKKVNIIGAGIAGLSAGCYLQMNGYQTQIFEMHDKPGGLVASWDRKGYNIQGSFQGLAGSSAANPFYAVWNDLFDISSMSFLDHDTKGVFEFEDGNRFYLYSNLDRLEEYMKDIAPEDFEVISAFINGAKRCQKISMPIEKPREFYGIRDYMKLIKFLPNVFFMKKWLNTSSDDFASRFKNQWLRKVMHYIQSPVLYEMMILSVMDLKASGYPTGGVFNLAKLIEQRYLSLGGEINYSSKVASIPVINHTAVGIELETGKQHPADIVISAADGKTTLEKMLRGRYTDSRLTKLYKYMKVNASRLIISLGVDYHLGNMPFLTKYILDKDKPFTIADGTSYDFIDIFVFRDMPDIVPSGKSLIRIDLETRNDEFWTELRETSRKKYQEVKKELAKEIIDILDRKLEGIKDKIDMIDVATPATYIRYTGNWKGSIQGWQSENIFKGNPFKKELKGLSNFYMCGQWVEPGCGVPIAALSGRNLAQIICKNDKISFVITSP